MKPVLSFLSVEGQGSFPYSGIWANPNSNFDFDLQTVQIDDPRLRHSFVSNKTTYKEQRTDLQNAGFASEAVVVRGTA